MSAASELDAYREEADLFLTALQEEYYLHYAGLKDSLELEPIYERFADLTTLEACQQLRAGTEGSATRRGGVIELWRFACEGHLGQLTREHQEKIAALEASLEAELDGETIGFRMLEPRIANEPDRGRRERIELVRVELAEELNPFYADAFTERSEAVRALGADTYRSLYEAFGFALEPLGERCSRFLEQTEDLYVAAFARLLRTRLGIGLDEARRSDVPRVFRAPAWDDGFPAEQMLPALEGTLTDLGVDLRAQRNVQLDVEARPTKSPRAFCAPIEVPARVVLVIQPIGGLQDWRALFHETGHTEHFAHTSPRLALEARRLGDDAVTETWAFLLEYVVTDPAWLTRRLDVGRPDELAAETTTVLLYYLRRYCAKLLYELELHSGATLDAMPDRYVELMREATKIEFTPVGFLADVDPGFYVTSYLRAWALEAQLRTALREQFGRAWFAERKAGALLRELWNEGQGLDADEIAREVTGSELSLDAVADGIREALYA
jgi:hypothetical protein